MKSLVALVGTKHRGEDAVALLRSLPNGSPLVLLRDARNAYDRNAVQVWTKDLKVLLGYVKASQNEAIATAIDARADNDGTPAISAKLAIDGGKWPMIEVDA
jgi:HIRAN domain